MFLWARELGGGQTVEFKTTKENMFTVFLNRREAFTFQPVVVVLIVKAFLLWNGAHDDDGSWQSKRQADV